MTRTDGGLATFRSEFGTAELDDEPLPYTEEELSDKSDVKHPPPAFDAVLSRMSYPVIIPQRRPGSKIRGRIRAYASVLADYNIDSRTFLDFLKSFYKASQLCHTSSPLPQPLIC